MEIRELTIDNLEEYLDLRVKMLSENKEVGCYDITKVKDQILY